MPEAERRLRQGDLDATSYEIDRRKARRSMFLAHGFEVSFAVAGLVTALQFLSDVQVRAQTAVGALGAAFAWSWTILFLIGSIGILLGMVRLDDRIEMAGLSCFSAAALVQSASIIQVRGLQGTYVALIFLAFVGGSLTRIHLLLALRRLGTSSTAREE